MTFSDYRRPSAECARVRLDDSPNSLRRGALALALGCALALGSGCASSATTAAARNAAGVESFSSGRYDDAIVLFQESLEDNPANAETCYNLASAYQRKATATGDVALLGQAENAYWTALENNPKPETIVCCYRGLATSAMARGDADGALQTLEAWRDRNPDSIEPKLEIAYLLEAQKKDAEAYDLLKSVAEEAPDDYRAFYKMGTLAERAGDLTDALENAETARKLNPTDQTVALRLNRLEAQYAARRDEEQTSNAVASAEFADQPGSGDSTPVLTTPVQTTSAQDQESEPIPQTATPSPDGQTSYQSPTQSEVVPGFGTAVALDRGGVEERQPESTAQNLKNADDDVDVKWIMSSNADRIRRQISQTSATTPVDSQTPGFANVDSDGSGKQSSLPNKTVSALQFAAPEFATANGSIPTSADSATTPQAKAKIDPKTTTANATTPATSSRQNDAAKPRAALHSGPPRVSAGSFF